MAFAAGQSHAQQTPRDTFPPAVLTLGKNVFEGRTGGALCFTCHGMNAKGTPGMGPDLTAGPWLHGDGSVASLERVIRSGVMQPKQFAGVMPPMGGGRLSAAQVRAVAAYVYSISER